MKNKKPILIVLALMLAACLSVTALAENPADASASGSAADAAKAAADTAQAAADAAQAENDALNAALEAYGKAKAESRKLAILTSLKEELDGYVAAGSLTQEQADLLLKYYAEQLTLQSGGKGFGQGGKNGRGGKGSGRGLNGVNNTGSGTVAPNGSGRNFRQGRGGYPIATQPQSPVVPSDQAGSDT